MALKNLFTAALLILAPAACADEPPKVDENFMLVLREVEGANKLKFGLEPSGPSKAILGNGEEVTLDNAWFDLIGDMHVRFVLDGENTMQNLSREEFAALGLTPEKAVEVAIENIKRRYGRPRATEWDEGIMLVSGESPDLDSSYFLDREFWDELLKEHPQGLVVGVPKRGGLIFAPASDAKAVAAMEASIRPLYESSGNLRVSSALYLYKAGAWSVFRPAVSRD